MRLFRAQITNYRNFRQAECYFGKHVVLLGENGAGKSNFFRALQLVLDPELPDSERQLDAEDFWAGSIPFAGSEIEISIEITDYSDEPSVMACIGEYVVEQPDWHTSDVARLTYRYAPKETIEQDVLPATQKSDYTFVTYGGHSPAAEIKRRLRTYVSFKLLHALRDAESDLRLWKRSPLRPLLEGMKKDLDKGAVANIMSQLNQIADDFAGQGPIVKLKQDIGAQLNRIIGTEHRMSPSFGFATTSERQLLQSLRLFVDKDRKWRISDTSLGLANVLYLSLLLLHTQQQEAGNSAASVLLGIEEPEAHLHPHMQRQVFRDLLNGSRSVLVSTHSPNIASVAPIESIVLVKNSNGEAALVSFANKASVRFSPQQRQDIQRYFDVTRAEMLFARGVILVEGDGERFIVPAACALLEPSINLDDYGISVCSVGGTDFTPYAKMLSTLKIPYAILTDGDSYDVNESGTTLGIRRSLSVLKSINNVEDRKLLEIDIAANDRIAAKRTLASTGIFVGERTLETDILCAGAGERMRGAILQIQPKAQSKTLNLFASGEPLTRIRERRILGAIERFGKGRFAQQLAPLLQSDDIPAYVRDCILWIRHQVAVSST